MFELYNVNPTGTFFFPGLTPASLTEWRHHDDLFSVLEGWNYGTFVAVGGAEPEQTAAHT